MTEDDRILCGELKDLADDMCLANSFEKAGIADDAEARIKALIAEVEALRIALHDAINHPIGVVPHSAEPYYIHGQPGSAR